MSSSLAKQIASIQKSIDSLKLKVKRNIDDCTSKKELKNFTVKELTAWLKKNGISMKKINEKRKDDYIKLIWKHLHEETDSETETDSDSEYTSDTDSDSDVP